MAARCSNATLEGTYIFVQDGQQIIEDKRVPFSFAGQDIYDGQGGLSGVQSGGTKGENKQFTTYTGTYTINEDCTGSSTLDIGGEISHFDLFVAPSGEKLYFVQTDPGFVSSGVEERVRGK